ncbi:hypothetical protein VPH35_089213 [Triticum aestivum]
MHLTLNRLQFCAHGVGAAPVSSSIPSLSLNADSAPRRLNFTLHPRRSAAPAPPPLAARLNFTLHPRRSAAPAPPPLAARDNHVDGD